MANILDLIGDKWTLLIVRDMLVRRKTRYKDFAESGETIPTNILANRLRMLENEKIISKKTYQTNPVRYEYTLTSRGKDLGPILMTMVNWAVKYIPSVKKPF